MSGLKTSIGYMPMMQCPSCGKDWQWDDYYNIQEDDERECPNCEAVAVVVETEVLMHVKLRAKP